MWRRIFEHPWCLPLLALLGMLLALPSVGTGFFGDDYLHRNLLLGHRSQPHPGSFFGLFTFVDGQSAHVQALKQSGQMAWWTADTLRLSFWRPVAELTHWLDYALWPESPALMHLHSVLWYGLLIWLVGRLYLLLDANPTRAALGTLIFALSMPHMLIVFWIAARNQLIAACLTVLTLMAFHHWRSQRSALHGWLAAVAFGASLLSAEAGLALLIGQHIGNQVAQGGQPWWPRWRALLPFVLIVVVWRLAYTHLGYGSEGSGAYIDPGADIPRFVQATLIRVPTLLLSAVFGVAASSLNQLPHAQKLLYALGACAALGLFALAAWRLRAWSTPRARFYALGAMLALVPACAAEPNDRLLLNAEIGTCALFGALFAHVLSRHRSYSGWGALAAKAVVGLSALVHLVVSPVMATASSLLMKRMTEPTTAFEPLSLGDARHSPGVHVIMLNPPVAMLAFYYDTIRAYFGLVNPASMQALANANQAITLTVVDPYAFILSGDKGFVDPISRDVVSLPFKAGDQIDIGTAQVTVLETTADHAPKRALFHFKAPLSDARWRFYAWGDDSHEPFTLPPVGASVVLPKQNIGKTMSMRLKGHGEGEAPPPRRM